mmetsp:Transcript_81983/g.219337  ORF Transcript_81983/g.219337 Transcript_81983/m.219337 type:complete len:770 (+) Transcript_81983:83-2392(+)
MRVAVTFALATTVSATSEGSTANPIRRVVSMLQAMQKKVEQEGEEAEELFAKFECYCNKNDEKLVKSIADGEQKISDLKTAQESDAAEKKQIDEELKQHKEERAAANDAVEQATSMRKKENGAFESESADLTANLKAMKAAVAAIEKGVSGAFLQSNEGAVFRHVVQAASDEYKSDLEAFLQSSQTGAGSDEIVGILKTMVDEMTARLDEITHNEGEAVENFNSLISAKNAEIAAAQEAIESKTARSGELAVKIATDANDLKATQKAVTADEGYLEELKKGCKQGSADYEETRKDRAEELVAIADTIKLLNSDDALELFKKSLPSPSLLQVQAAARSVRDQALDALRSAHGVNVGLIMTALHGKKQGFEEVLKMIDEMAKALKQEQEDDIKKKEYCGEEINKVQDHIKQVDFQIGDLSAQIEAQEEAIETYTADIKTLKESIKDLDKAVAEATEQRKAEHEAYVAEAADNNAALELLGFAKNRLNKFYNPKQYKEPPQEELSEEEKVEQAYSFVQIRSHSVDAPPPPPAMPKRNKQEGGGVIGLLNNIISDLKLEMNQDKLTEEDAQADYEKLAADAAAKREASVQSLSEKEAALAQANGDLLDLKESKKDAETDKSEAHATEMNLHAECDWLVENFETRKTARTEELEALEKAKAVLSGADFSLLQVESSSKPATLLSKSRETSCLASDEEHRRMLASKFALLQGFCEDMCKVVGKHPDCSVCEGFIPPDATPGVQTWDELYAQFDKLKLVGRDMIKEWTGDAGKFGR